MRGPLSPGTVLTLLPEETAHLRARRISEGAHITLLDGTGAVATGILGPDDSVTVLSSTPSTPQTRSLSALIALPKSPSRADWAVEKLVELGISRILWTQTERVVAAVPNEARLKRWNRLVVAAAKQSLRADVPSVEKLPAFADAVDAVRNAGLALLLSADGPPILTDESLNAVRAVNDVIVVVGPEGGLTDQEEEQFVQAGAMRVGLGQNRLRVETAVVAAVAVVAQIEVQESAREGKSFASDCSDVEKGIESLADGLAVKPVKNLS